MFIRHTKRIIVGVFCAIITGVLAVAIGEAGAPRQEGPVRTDCQDCHESVVHNWQDSAHGDAAVNTAFQDAWQEKGSPPECLSCHATEFDAETGDLHSDGIECATCHFGQTGPHPETPMPTDPSSRSCGNCHLDTYNEWQASAHGEGELACVRCHNPHTTNLKVGNMYDLCTDCHNEEGHFYGMTSHAQQGLQCTDCHLRVSESPMGEGHGQRLHTFSVDLDTCNECHGEQMHFPVPGEESTETSEMMLTAYAPDDGASSRDERVVGQTVDEEPPTQPVQSINYILVAIAGMGFGMALTPYAENWYKRLVSKD